MSKSLDVIRIGIILQTFLKYSRIWFISFQPLAATQLCLTEKELQLHGLTQATLKVGNTSYWERRRFHWLAYANLLIDLVRRMVVYLEMVGFPHLWGDKNNCWLMLFHIPVMWKFGSSNALIPPLLHLRSTNWQGERNRKYCHCDRREDRKDGRSRELRGQIHDVLSSLILSAVLGEAQPCGWDPLPTQTAVKPSPYFALCSAPWRVPSGFQI